MFFETIVLYGWYNRATFSQLFIVPCWGLSNLDLHCPRRLEQVPNGPSPPRRAASLANARWRCASAIKDPQKGKFKFWIYPFWIYLFGGPRSNATTSWSQLQNAAQVRVAFVIHADFNLRGCIPIFFKSHLRKCTWNFIDVH